MVFPITALPIKVELDAAGAWADITSYVYSRDSIEIQRGRPDESSTIDASKCKLTINNRDGRFSPRNPVGAYYGLIGRNTPLRVSVTQSAGWLQTLAVSDSTVTPTYVTTPDTATLDITGDLDLRVDVDLESWYDVTELISKWTTTGNQRSYALVLQANGTLALWISADGSTISLSRGSTIPVPITQGRLAVRATIDVNNGAGGHTITFYTAATSAGPWEQLGQARTTTGTTSLFSSSAVVRLLDNPDSDLGGSLIRGRMYSAQIYSGIAGTLVANPDFAAVAAGASSFVDSTGKTWTLTGDVEVTYQDVRFIGEVSAFPQKWDITGSDVYTPVVAAGLLQRLSQGKTEFSSLYRSTVRESGVLAYWSMEDESDATAIGAATNSTKPIKLTSSVELASSSVFKCSKPIPLVGTAPLVGVVPVNAPAGVLCMRFLLSVPAAGLSGGSIIASLFTRGSAARCDLLYGTGSGGTLALRIWDPDGAVVSTSGTVAFNVDGELAQVMLTLTNDGADLDWTISAYYVGDATFGFTSGTQVGRNVGAASKAVVNFGSSADYANVAIGHLTVGNTELDLSFLAVNAHSGELATERMERLCREEGVEFSHIGAFRDSSTFLGYQLPKTMLALLREATEADGGLLYEARDFLALNYRARTALGAQPPQLSLDYTANQLNSMEPTEDDQLIRNDVTVARVGGGSARAELLSGPLSTDVPPAGVGRYDTSVEISVDNDDQLADQASWRRHLGTVDEARLPVLDLLLESSHLAGVAADLIRLDLGDRLTIDNPPAWLAQETVDQMVQGYEEVLSQFSWRISPTCSPGSPWNTGVYGESETSTFSNRYGADNSTTTEALDTTETAIDVTSEDGRWTLTAASWPFDVMIGGELITVAGVTGTSGTAQVLTPVTRSVNGVVKTHASGAAVQLYPLAYYAL